MYPFNWLCQLAGKCFGNSPNTLPQARSKRPCNYRPTLEILEDRLAPATITTLASFDGGGGFAVAGALLKDANGNLFGTTANGGAFGYGTVFELRAASRIVTVLASFDGIHGAYPNGPLVEDGAGNLFGTTSESSATSSSIAIRGTVFELKAGSGTITTIAVFNANSAGPNGGLVIDADGNLFGTTRYGSGNLNDPGVLGGPAVGDGTVFEVKAGSNTITTIVSFNGTNGSSPNGLVRNASGNLFGTMPGGVFEVKAGTETVTTFATLGIIVSGLAVDPYGNLFGMTALPAPAYPGPIQGSYSRVFEVKAGSGTVTTVSPAPFDLNSDTAVDESDNLFGTVAVGGNGYGTVVEIKAGSGTPIVLASFNGTNGAHPNSGLLVDANGNLIGTTSGGGANNDGTIFEIASAAASQTAFVHVAYEQLLHRSPEAGGLAHWIGLLNSGVSPSTVILDIEQSTEYIGNEVTALYHQFLRRTPEASGLQHWVSQLAGGASIEQVTADILASPEYFAEKGGDEASFVRGLYHDLLGRGGLAAEVQGWLHAQDGGMSRFQVASAFLASQEYGTHLIDSYYSQFLGRSPEASGLASWLQQFQAGTSQDTIQAEIFGSDEGLAKWS